VLIFAVEFTATLGANTLALTLAMT